MRNDYRQSYETNLDAYFGQAPMIAFVAGKYGFCSRLNDQLDLRPIRSRKSEIGTISESILVVHFVVVQLYVSLLFNYMFSVCTI